MFNVCIIAILCIVCSLLLVGVVHLTCSNDYRNQMKAIEEQVSSINWPSKHD